MNKEITKVIILYIIFLIVIFRGTIFGDYTFFAHGDASIQSVAWLAKIENGLRAGSLPLWDFNTDAGTSFIGEMQTSVLYPPAWIFSLIPPYLTLLKFEIFILIHFFWAALGGYLFIRLLGVSQISAFIGGLFFALVGPAAMRATAQPNLHAGVVQIPWILYFALKALKLGNKDSYRSWVFMSICAAMSILAGHMHAFIHAIFAVAILVPFFSKNIIRDYLKFSAAFILSLGLACGQIIASHQYFKHSYKWFGDGFTAHPHIVPFQEFIHYRLNSLVTLFDFSKGVPDGGNLFITYTGLFIAILGFVYVLTGLRSRFSLIFVPTLVIISISMALAGDNLVGKILYQIPFLNIVRAPVRILHLYSIASATLIALGIHYIRSNQVGKYISVILIALLAYEANSIIKSSLFLKANQKESASSYYAKTKIVNWLINQNQIEQGLFRYAVNPNQLLPPNLGNFYDIKSISGHRSSKQINFYNYLARSWDYRSNLFDLLSLKYIVTTENYENLKILFEDQGVKIYEKPDALGIIYIQQNNTRENLPKDTKVTWSNNSVRIKLPDSYISNDSNSRIYLAQANYPGWRVKVNGKTKELKLDDIFYYTELGSEPKEIVFYYSSRTVFVGLYLNLFILLSICIWLFINKKPANKN